MSNAEKTFTWLMDYCLNTNNSMKIRIIAYKLMLILSKEHDISLEYSIDHFTDIKKAIIQTIPE